MKHNYLFLLVPIVLSGSLAACSDDMDDNMGEVVNCELETRADTYVAGLAKVGAGNGIQVVLVEATPAPPVKGENTWRLQVLDEVDTPLDNLTLAVTPFMPDHGHGSVSDALVTPQAAAGEYEVTPINLQMPGYWEMTIDVDNGAGMTDQVVMGFCVEG